MKTNILILFATCAASVNSKLNVETETYFDFPNNCTLPTNLSPFLHFGQKFYIIDPNQMMNWYGAAHFCRAKDADLASILSADEMKAISDGLISLGDIASEKNSFWISGNDLGNQGEYEWLGKGIPMSYTKWFKSQPDNKDEHCVLLLRDNDTFYMHDDKCDKKTYAICESNIPKTVAITIW